MNVTKSATTTS